MSNIRTGGIGQSKWVRPACLFVVLIAANVFTYWFLCRPELEMKKMDAKGYSYLQTVLGRAGGIWSLSAHNAALCTVFSPRFLSWSSSLS
jgi:hypothetical protein